MKISEIISALQPLIATAKAAPVPCAHTNSAIAYLQAAADAFKNRGALLNKFVADFDAAIAAKQPTPPLPPGVTIEQLRAAAADVDIFLPKQIGRAHV